MSRFKLYGRSLTKKDLISLIERITGEKLSGMYYDLTYSDIYALYVQCCELNSLDINNPLNV